MSSDGQVSQLPIFCCHFLLVQLLCMYHPSLSLRSVLMSWFSWCVGGSENLMYLVPGYWYLVPGTGIGIDSVLVLVPGTGSTWYNDTRYQGSYSDSRRLPGTRYRYLVHAPPLRCMKQLAYLIPALHREFPYQEEPSFTTTSTSIRIWYTEQYGYLFRILWWSARYQVV